uniref:Uncharacterized protein n=1 Tax=Oryza glumipatula TaxID=40148 RepID=A0A0E0BL04_9ORYZ
MDSSAAAAAAASDEAAAAATVAAAAAEVVTGVDCANDAAAAATTVDGDGGDENSKQQQPSVNKLHMPQEYVDYILAWKKRPFPLPDDDDDREILSPEHRKMREGMAATCNELGDGFEEFQAEVRREVEEKGFYEVDESYFANQAEIQAQLKEGWAKIDWGDIVFAD